MTERFLGLWALIFIRPMLVLGVLIAAIGASLVLFSAGYFALAVYSEADLDELAVTQVETGLTREDLMRDLPTPEPTVAPLPTSTATAMAASVSGPVSAPAPVATASTPATETPQSPTDNDDPLTGRRTTAVCMTSTASCGTTATMCPGRTTALCSGRFGRNSRRSQKTIS